MVWKMTTKGKFNNRETDGMLLREHIQQQSYAYYYFLPLLRFLALLFFDGPDLLVSSSREGPFVGPGSADGPALLETELEGSQHW